MAITLRGASAVLYRCQDDEVLIEGRAGTGKSIGACKKLVDCAFGYPGANILLCRQTRQSMTDSILITLESVIGETNPEVTRMSRENRHAYQLNGSQIVCAGLDEPAKAFGTGWDLIYLNEAIEANLNAWELFGRAARDPRLNRGGNNKRMPYRQHIADLNPGPPNHWANLRAFPANNTLRAVKTYEDWRRLDQYNSGPQAGPMRRLISVHQDNPSFFDVGAWAYNNEGNTFLTKKLGSMSGHNLQRMLHGIWCAAEGSVYPKFREDLNVWDEFIVPPDWPLYWGTDPGFDHPCAILWFTVTPSDELVCVEESIESGKSVSEHAQTVKAIEAKRGWSNREVMRFGDPQHAFSRTAQSKKTIAEQWADEGIKIGEWPRTGDNMDGMVDAVRQLINKKKLIFTKNCQKAIAAHQSWSFARNSDGTPKDGAQGRDKYEEEFKDPCDVTRGITATNPRHIVQKMLVVGMR